MAKEVDKRRVLMIAYHFPPDMEVGARRVTRFAKYLPKLNWEPVVLTVDEHYYDSCDPNEGIVGDTTVLRTRMAPGPRDIARNLKNFVLRRKSADPVSPEDSGARNVASELDYVPPERTSFLQRLFISLIWIPDDSQGWIAPAVRAARKLVKEHKIDVLYTTGPPWSGHVIGWATSVLTGKPLIADFRDPWMDGPMKPAWKPDWSRTFLGDWGDWTLERLAVRRAARVVCVCERQRQVFLRMHPNLPADKFVVIPNGYDPDEFAQLKAVRATSGGPLTLTYAGKLYFGRDPGNLLLAAQQLIERGALRPEEIRIRFLGRCDHVRGVPLATLAERCGLGGVVEAPGELPRAQCLEELRKSDVLLLLAMEQKDQVPAKLFEYLMMEKPILAFTEEDGATAEVIRETESGAAIDMEDLPGVTAALESLVRRHREGTLAAQLNRRALARYSAEMLTSELAGVMDAALARRG